MKLLQTDNGNFNLASPVQVAAFTTTKAEYLAVEVDLGDGVDDIAGDGAYRLAVLVGGVGRSDSYWLVGAGVTRETKVVDIGPVGAGVTVAVQAQGLAADTDVDVTTRWWSLLNDNLPAMLVV